SGTLRQSGTLLDHLCGNQGHCGDQGHCGNQGHCWATCVAIRDTAWPLRRYCWATFVTIRDTAWPLRRSGTLLGHLCGDQEHCDDQGHCGDQEHCWATMWRSGTLTIRDTAGPLVGRSGPLVGNQGYLWAIRDTCG
ncbi:unnamed protein product, partial [Staurois parvus]